MKRVPPKTSWRLVAFALALAACSGSLPPPAIGFVAVPPGFPPDVPVPGGSVTLHYTGSADIGFELNVTTTMAEDELIAFVSDAVALTETWSLSPADPGLPVLPGYDADWVMLTQGDQVITGPAGTYEGGIGVAGSNVNILLTPTMQPRDGLEPPTLPGRTVLPRPATQPTKTSYSHGKINVTYPGGEGVYDGLVDDYRAAGWVEAEVSGHGGGSADRSAAGELGEWMVSIRDFFALNGGPIILEFESKALTFP